MKLVVASLNYSSWSVRAWLALEHAGADFSTHRIELFVDPQWKQKVLQFSGAGKVPVLVDGPLSIHEALAICEYANERFPEANLWPEDLRLRARARAISQEMASGFLRIRDEMSMNFRGRAQGFVPSEAAQSEVARIFDIWEASLEASGGPFLFGDFGIADCMYLPVLSRVQTYGIPLPGHAARYAAALWEQPSVKRWATLAVGEPAIPEYDAKLGA